MREHGVDREKHPHLTVEAHGAWLRHGDELQEAPYVSMGNIGTPGLGTIGPTGLEQ